MIGDRRFRARRRPRPAAIARRRDHGRLHDPHGPRGVRAHRARRAEPDHGVHARPRADRRRSGAGAAAARILPVTDTPAQEAGAAMSAPSQVSILDGSTFVVSDGSGDIEAVADRHAGPVPSRTRATFALGLDGQRQSARTRCRPTTCNYFAAQFFLVRVDRHDLRRRDALGHPQARGRRRLPRGSDDPQPRRRAGRPRRAHRRRPPTSPTCSRSRTR